jgi:hypothetical protein
MMLLLALLSLSLSVVCLVKVWRDGENRLYAERQRQARLRSLQWRKRWGDDDT